MKILIAEDDLLARTFLESSLESWGYEVVVTANGKEAWEVLQKADAPRLVILDWNMPEMDGVEVCEKIRASENEHYTYVILVTSLKAKEEIDVAYQKGVDDYLIKPYNEDQLKRRLKAGLRVVDYEAKLAGSKKQLEDYANRMEDLAEKRGRQLAHAERMATLGILSAGIAHEINNPTTFIAGNVQVLNDFWPIIKNSLESRSGGTETEKNQADFILQETPKIVTSISNGIKRITKIVDGLKTYARQGDVQMGPCDVNHCVDQALELCFNSLKYHVKIEKNLQAGLPVIMADAQQIEQVLVNLFINAADAIKTKKEGNLFISTYLEDSRVMIDVKDDGPGFSPDAIGKIWEPFFTTKEPGKGTGLGLSIIQSIVENHGGVITAENRKTGGALFSITLPLDQNEKPRK